MRKSLNIVLLVLSITTIISGRVAKVACVGDDCESLTVDKYGNSLKEEVGDELVTSPSNILTLLMRYNEDKKKGDNGVNREP
jgi:hypothetical protein